MNSLTSIVRSLIIFQHWCLTWLRRCWSLTIRRESQPRTSWTTSGSMRTTKTIRGRTSRKNKRSTKMFSSALYFRHLKLKRLRKHCFHTLLMYSHLLKIGNSSVKCSEWWTKTVMECWQRKSLRRQWSGFSRWAKGKTSKTSPSTSSRRTSH